MRLSPPLIHLLLLSSSPPFPSPPFPGHLSLGFPVIAGSTQETGRRSHSSASATPLASSLPSLATFPAFHMWRSFPSCVSSFEIFSVCLQIISCEHLFFWQGLDHAVARLHLWLFVQHFKDFSKGKTLWKIHLQLNFNGASPLLSPRFYSPTAGIHIQWLLDLRPFPNTLLVEFMRRGIAKQ